MRVVLAASLVLSLASSAFAQSPDTAADAYFKFLIARRLESQGDAEGALKALKEAQALDPKSAEVLAEIAGFHARQEQAPEAVAAAEKALTIDPNNVEAHRMLGLVMSALSESGAPPLPGRTRAQMRASAVEHLSTILDSPLMATDLNLQMTLARLQLRSGRADRAVPILENIVSQAPYATEPYTLLAEGRMALGRIDAAIEALQLAADINPRHFITLGDLLERQGRSAQAAAAFEEGIARNKTRGPDRDLRLRWFAALLNIPENQGAAKARDALKDFLMTNPKDARGLFLLSRANLQLNDFAGAETVARQLIALDPASIAGLHALSDALVGRREFRQVVELLTPFAKDAVARSKGRESDAALLLALLAQAHTELGEHDQAVTVLSAAVARDPLSAPALNSLGYSLADRGQRLPEAVAFIERALKVDPENPSYLDSLGWALFKQGRAEEAEPHLRKAADALPAQSVIQDHFGDVLVRRGKINEAIGAWERALAGDGADINRQAIEKKIKDARGKQQ